MAEKQCNLIKNGGGMMLYPTASNPTIKIGEYDGHDVYMTRYAGTVTGLTDGTSKAFYLENDFGTTKQILDYCGYQFQSDGSVLVLPKVAGWSSNTLTIVCEIGVNSTGLFYHAYSHHGSTYMNNQSYVAFVTWYYK